jgi:hypothetical protein
LTVHIHGFIIMERRSVTTIDLTDLAPSAPAVIDALAALRLPRPRPVHPAIVAARTSLEATLHQTARLPDEALARSWRWRGAERVDVRYGIYRLFEVLEEATVMALRTVALLGEREAAAGQILCQATQARWDLHGLLLPLADGDLDRPPGGAEWTLRETLGHVASTQARYTLNTAFWALTAPAPDRTPPDVPETPLTMRGQDAAWSVGTILDIRSRLDALLDLAVGLFGDLDDASRLEAMGIWVGYPVTIRFRLHRFAAHLREHTIQVEKTLALLGRQPTEVERIVRIILGAYGRLEAIVFCLPDGTLDRAIDDGRSLAGLLTATTREAAAVADTLDA